MCPYNLLILLVWAHELRQLQFIFICDPPVQTWPPVFENHFLGQWRKCWVGRNSDPMRRCNETFACDLDNSQHLSSHQAFRNSLTNGMNARMNLVSLLKMKDWFWHLPDICLLHLLIFAVSSNVLKKRVVKEYHCVKYCTNWLRSTVRSTKVTMKLAYLHKNFNKCCQWNSVLRIGLFRICHSLFRKLAE